MKRSGRLTAIAILIALVAISGLPLDASAQTRRKPVVRKKTVVKRTVAPAVKLYSVSSGKRVRARINNTISSKTARIGDTFTASTTEPIYSTTGVVVIPEGSELQGRVDAGHASAEGRKAGYDRCKFYAGASAERNDASDQRFFDGSLQ